ncbi:LOW QUALITY PROTEIN: cyclin-D5-1-like [Primulina eburnea]|uniref:LOW QUALITY PROTEIN: cyclin-D5-1-like n=1 Tax=Primulina eburnea TaxID=1245227 RepID=UPI003C6C5042
MEDFETPLSNLLCNENESCLEEQYNQKDENFELYPVSESDCDYIENLIQRETSFQASGSDYSVKDKRSWFKCARLDAIKWILDAKGRFGFHLSTAYLSMIYLDRFFSRRWIDEEKLWAIRLLSVASLSIAAKMEEREVPGLSEYHVDEYNFEGTVIKKMELFVLNTLEWRMSYATPFAYLNYFTTKFCEELRHKELVTRAADLILTVMEEIDVSEHRPSVVAAAAVLAAYDNQLTKKLLTLKINAIPSWGYLEKEHTFSCYNLLQEIVTLKSKTPISNIPRNLLSTNSSSIDVLDDTTTGIGTKRRLTYTDGDLHCPLHKVPKS